MSTISGIISAALPQTPPVSSLSAASSRALDDVLKQFTPTSFSKSDFLNLSDELKKAGIAATPEVKSAIEAKGLDIAQYIDAGGNAASDAFGPAVTLDLSAPAQAVVSDASTVDAPANPAPISGGVSYDSVSVTVTRAKREVSPQVGIGGADEVVDGLGNIDYAKLQKLVDIQATKKAS